MSRNGEMMKSHEMRGTEMGDLVRLYSSNAMRTKVLFMFWTAVYPAVYPSVNPAVYP